MLARTFAAFVALVITACATMPDDPLAGSRQLIVVVTPDERATVGLMRRYERDSQQDRWREVGSRAEVVVGRAGLAPIETKREGDGKSPAGIFTLGTAFGFAATADTRLPYRQLKSTTECVDDVSSRHYNTIVERDEVASVDWTSSEKMRTIDQYRLGIVVNHNTPPVAGNGSCIFLHLWGGPSSTTAGCTAMSDGDFEALLRWLDPSANPRLVQVVTGSALPPGVPR